MIYFQFTAYNCTLKKNIFGYSLCCLTISWIAKKQRHVSFSRTRFWVVDKPEPCLPYQPSYGGQRNPNFVVVVVSLIIHWLHPNPAPQPCHRQPGSCFKLQLVDDQPQLSIEDM